MNRLPNYDSKSSRAERAAFLGLGVVAIALITITGYDASRFAVMRDEIPKATPISDLSVAGSDSNSAMKKVTTLAPRTPPENAGVNGAAPRS
jgi:hypothetical protein